MNSIDKNWVDNHIDSNGEVIIPDGVEKIEPEAFKDNELVRKVIMPDTVIEIGDNAFTGCLNLQDIKFSNNIKVIGEDAFLDCKKVTSIELPKSIEMIKEEAFARCESLEKFLIDQEAKISEIQDTLFYECKSLKEVKLPKSIISIGSYAFYSCESMTNFDLDFFEQITTIQEKTFAYCEALESINIPQTVKDIQNGAFRGCTKLSSIEFDENSSLAQIGEYAFAVCKELHDIKLPDSVVSLEKSAFNSCSNLEHIDLGNGLRQIGKNAFNSCDSLSIVEGGENIEEIGLAAFANCKSMMRFTIPSKVKTLKIPFENCSQLEELNYGEGVQELDAVGLEGVKNLKKVVLNANLKYVPEATFTDCKQLEEVEINGTHRVDYGLLKGKSTIKRLVIDDYEIALNESEEFFTIQKSENKVIVVVQDEKGTFKTKCINLEKRTEKDIADNLYLTEEGSLCFARNNLSECSLDFLNKLKKRGQTHLYIYGASRNTNPTEFKNKINYDLYSIDDLIEIKTKINKIKQNIIIPPENDKNRQKEIYSQIVTQLSKNMEYDYYEAYTDITLKGEEKKQSQESIKREFEKITGKNWDEYFEQNKNRNIVTAQLEAGNLLGLLSGKAVCRGNAEIIRNIAAEFGIEVSVILGAKHAWNQVQLDGIWYDDDFTQYQGYLSQGKIATSSQRFLCGEENGKSEFSSIELYKKVYSPTNKVGDILSRDEKKVLLNYGIKKQQTIQEPEKRQEQEQSIKDEVGDESKPKTQEQQQNEQEAEAKWMNSFQACDQEVAKMLDGAKKKQEVVQLIQNLEQERKQEQNKQIQEENENQVQGR